MHKSLIALAVFSVMSTSAVAQTAPHAHHPQAAPAAPQVAETTPAKPKMVKKTVCTRVIEEETTGSRLGSAPKVCKTVEVPAGGSGKGDRAPSTSSD